MRLWLSGELQHDVALSYTDTARHLRRILRPVVSGANYGKSVVEWAFIGILQQRDTRLTKEGWQFFKPRGLAEFRLRIDYNAFRDSDDLDRSRLIFCSLLRSASLAPNLNIEHFNAEQFASDLIEVGVTHGLL
jgi:hypothetical protein